MALILKTIPNTVLVEQVILIKVLLHNHVSKAV